MSQSCKTRRYNFKKILFQKKFLKISPKRNSKHVAADPVLNTQLNHSTITHTLHSRIIKTKKLQRLLEFTQKPAPKKLKM